MVSKRQAAVEVYAEAERLARVAHELHTATANRLEGRQNVLDVMDLMEEEQRRGGELSRIHRQYEKEVLDSLTRLRRALPEMDPALLGYMLGSFASGVDVGKKSAGKSDE